jgi:hypothetical protein
LAAYRVYRKAIKRASEIVGGAYVLAVKIDAQPELVLHWLEDRGTPDERSFQRAMQIVLAHDGQLPWTQVELEAELAARPPRR